MTDGIDLGAAWRGRAPLAVAYWGWGVAANMTLLALLAGAWAAGAAPPLLWLLWSVGVVWHAVAWAAIWSSAAAYRGPRRWAVLARSGLFLGIPRLTAEAAVLALAV